MACPSSAAEPRGASLAQPWRAEVAELLLSVTVLEARLNAQQASAAGILPSDLIVGSDVKGAELKAM